jgi:alpha-ketoglutarate-dependent taurine dioxygenase
LDEGTKQRLASLRAVHNLDFSRTRRHGEDPMTEEQKKARPPVDHPIIRIHPETGRKCVFLGDHAWCIQGLPFGEGRQLIEDLNARIIDPERVYTHRWRPGDLVVWDNRCMLLKKHIVRRQLGRLEPTPFLKYRADEVMRNMPLLST